jgi:predicted dehydrogenase
MIARDRARVIAVGAVGLSLPRKIYYEKELTFINSRSYGPGRYDPSYEEGGRDYPIGYVRWTEGRNLEAMVDLLASRKVDVHPLITHRFPIHQAPQAYELITGKRKEPFLGVLLTYAQKETGAVADETTPRQGVTAPSAAIPTAPALHRATGAVRMGVLGAGNFASAVMLPAMRSVQRIQLVGIASASGMSAQHAAKRFGFQYADSNAARLLEDAEIEAVAILTRHHLHAQQTLAALQAGKHVFCEKPLALNAEELDGIEAALRSHPAQILSVGFNRRFAPLATQLKTFLQGRQEPLAAHYRVNAGYLPLNHWTHDPQQGGGRIIGEACHFIDFLTFLVGAAPTEVAARGLPDNGRYREDNVVISLTFSDGSLGTISYLANGDKAFPKERVEVFCSGRVAVLDDYRSLELVSQGSRKVYSARLRQDKGHRAEMEAFARAIQSGGPPPIPYEQIFGVTRAAFAAVESLRNGSLVRIGSVQQSNIT